MTEDAPSNRRIDTCPRCAATMTQYDRKSGAVWSIGELATDLARCSEDDDAWLIWYSACPNGCKQCFRCLEWLSGDAACQRCPLCPECGRPLMTFIDEDEDGVETETLGCMRCSNDADEAKAEAGHA